MNDKIMLSPNISLMEMLATSQTDLQKQNVEEAAPYIVNMYILAQYILQPIRTYFGQPLIISSGFRGETLNKRIGGVNTSDHSIGLAADITVKSVSDIEVIKAIMSNRLPITFRQMILEVVNGKRWIHLAALRDFDSYTKGDKYKNVLFTKDSRNYQLLTPELLQNLS